MKGGPFSTEEDDAIIRAMDDCEGVGTLHSRLDRSRSSVYRRARALGVLPPRHAWTSEETVTLARSIESGLLAREISRILRRSPSNINSQRVRCNLPLPAGVTRDQWLSLRAVVSKPKPVRQERVVAPFVPQVTQFLSNVLDLPLGAWK